MTFGPLSSFRDFSVEGVADPQLENRGQGAGPAGSSQLSPDSALFEGSPGSLEQQPDAGGSSKRVLTSDGADGGWCGTSCLLSALPVSDTDSLSQGSSAGSLCLEEDEDRSSLKNHFEALASSLSEGGIPPRQRDRKPPTLTFPLCSQRNLTPI